MVLNIQPESSEPKTKFPSDLLEEPVYGFEKGDKVRVTRIKEAASGKGYSLFTEAVIDPLDGEYCVMDFVWKNSKTGKIITAIFQNVKIADDTRILMTIQADLKTAVISSEECEGGYWENDEPGVLSFYVKPIGAVAKHLKNKNASAEQP